LRNPRLHRASALVHATVSQALRCRPWVGVEVDVAAGLPGYHVVGLAALPVKEGAVRTRSALEQVGLGLPDKKLPTPRRSTAAASTW